MGYIVGFASGFLECYYFVLANSQALNCCGDPFPHSSS